MVSATLKGTVIEDSQIVVLRTVVVPSSGASAQMSIGELPFAAEQYLLGIRRSQSYPAWITVGGPAGRIAFTEDETAIVEELDIGVQEQAAGKRLIDVVSLIQAYLESE